MQNVYESPAMELVEFESAEDVTILSSLGPIDTDPNSHSKDNEIGDDTWD